MSQLPNPATNQDFYSVAIVTELRRLNSNVERLTSILDEITQASEPEATGTVELREPEPEATGTVELREPEPVKKAAHRDAKKAKGKDGNADGAE